MKLLEENDRQGQAQDLSLLMFYMDGMTRQFEAVSKELQEVRQQLAQAQESPAKKAIGRMVEALGHKVEQAREALDDLRERITDCAKNAVENFKEAGVTALDKAVSAIGVKNVLESLQEKISGMLSDTKQNIAKVENIGHELRSVGGHLKNAGRAHDGRPYRQRGPAAPAPETAQAKEPQKIQAAAGSKAHPGRGPIFGRSARPYALRWGCSHAEPAPWSHSVKASALPGGGRGTAAIQRCGGRTASF